MTYTAQPPLTRCLIAWVTALAVLLAPLAIPTAAADDARSQARQYYADGKNRFNAGDYQGAIRSFEKANQLAPSPVLQFNIGLSYEKLGNKREAVRRYQAYLKLLPSAPNRDMVQAKITFLSDGMRVEQNRSVSAGTTGPTGPDTTPGGSTPPPAGGAVNPVPTAPPVAAPTPVQPGPAVSGTVPAPPTTAPAPPQTETPPVAETLSPIPTAPPIAQQPTTGDPQLDRVAAIDVGMVRDQRMPMMSQEPPPPPGQQSMQNDTAKTASKPAYKQIWFWVVVGVSALILLDIAASSSGATAFDSGNSAIQTAPVLMRF